jgi:hypothetical protein
MKERGEGSNTAIVAIVVLVLVGLFAFLFFGGRLGQGGGESSEIKVNIGKQGEAPAAPAAPKEDAGGGAASKEASPP